MSWRAIVKRSAVVAGAIACAGLALALALLATDVGRWQDVLAQDDVRYRVSPDEGELWHPSTFVPLRAAERVLDVEEDVAFRQAVRAVRLARLDEAVISDPELATRRNDAQARLEAIVAATGAASRQSRAAGLLGVIGLARLVSETEERGAVLEKAIADLRLAIALDPSNDEAKYNLELALQRSRGIQLAESAGGPNPSPGGTGSKGAGAGDPGSGY